MKKHAKIGLALVAILGATGAIGAYVVVSAPPAGNGRRTGIARMPSSFRRSTASRRRTRPDPPTALIPTTAARPCRRPNA